MGVEALNVRVGEVGTRQRAHILGIEINVETFHTSPHACRKTGLFHTQAG
jgi:hypothetical protein